MKSITILIPAYNEEPVLPTLYARLTSLAATLPHYEFEFLFVNDGSSDDTINILKQLVVKDDRISYVNLSRNFGKEIAMIAGIDHVKSDSLVIIDADLQDPPELIPEMIKLWEQGYDDIYARRSKRLGESWLKKASSSLFYRLLQRSTDIPIQRDTGDFRLLDRRCIDALQQIRERERYTKGLFSWIGFNKKEIRYVRDPRAAGETKWNYFKLVNLAIDGIVSFTTAPLRFSTILGMLISFFSFIYIIVIIIRTLIFGIESAGYPSIMAVVLFLGGVQLLSLGIIGEYIGRIFNETKQRPLYLVDEYHQKKAK
ncbi:MAG: hypothetical protein JWN75_827 [Candidatus Saccharibacteria bacterium]|nr:hypothetical protein [Candidatus Saccharibacteria bacterium]